MTVSDAVRRERAPRFSPFVLALVIAFSERRDSAPFVLVLVIAFVELQLDTQPAVYCSANMPALSNAVLGEVHRDKVRRSDFANSTACAQSRTSATISCPCGCRKLPRPSGMRE